MIGTLAKQARDAGFEVALVTGDKDFFQLVGDGVRVFNPRDDGTWYDAAGVVEKFGVRPDQVVDVLALMGDSVDNIKGVPGIGEKGARELIAAHGHARRAARSGRDRAAEALSRGAPRQCRLGAVEPRAGAHPHGRAGGVRPGGAALPRPVARALLRALLVARVPVADAGVRAHRRDEPARLHRGDESRRRRSHRDGAVRRDIGLAWPSSAPPSRSCAPASSGSSSRRAWRRRGTSRSATRD